MRRLGILASLYFAQGLPFGFFSHAVPVLLNRSHPPHIVGLSSLLALPWGLKFLWAPWVDRLEHGRLGRRKRVLIPLQLLTVLALVGLGLLPASDDHLTPLVVGFFVVSVLSATQDIATDALAIDLLPAEERGHGGGVQAGAYRAGMIAGGGGVLALLDVLGYREAFLLMAGAVLVTTLPLHALTEPRVSAPAERGGAPAASLLLGFFRSRRAIELVVLLVGFKLGDALAAGMVTRLFVKHGLSTADVALSRGLVGGLASILGAGLAAGAVRALGLRRSLVGAAALQTLAIGMYLVLLAMHPIRVGVTPLPMSVYHTLSAVEHLLGGAATATLFALMMERCRDEARATDYTLQSSVLVGVTGVGVLASGFVTRAAGLEGLFALATALGLLAPLAAARLARPERGSR